MKKISRTPNRLFLFLAIVSLMIIAVFFLKNLAKTYTPRQLTEGTLRVLGIHINGKTVSLPADTGAKVVNDYMSNSLEDMKESLSDKSIELQEKIVGTVEKEASNFAKSQLDEIKLKICTQWGVVTPPPIK